MATRQIELTLKALFISGIVLLNGAVRLSAQESSGFSSNMPYQAPLILTESERKNIIKVAAGETQNRIENLAEKPGEIGPEMAPDSKVSPDAAGQSVVPAADRAQMPVVTPELGEKKVGAGQIIPSAKADSPTENKGLKKDSYLLVRSVGSFVFVIALIAGLTWLSRRFLPLRRLTGGSVIQVLSRTPINARQTVCLIKVGSRLLVVGVSAGHMTTLESIDNPEEVTQLMGLMERDMPGSITSMHSFKGLFKREAHQYDEASTGDEIVQDGDLNRTVWQEARAELGGLFSKVKGLSRMRS